MNKAVGGRSVKGARFAGAITGRLPQATGRPDRPARTGSMDSIRTRKTPMTEATTARRRPQPSDVR